MKCQGVASLEQVVEFVSSMVAKDAFSSFRHWKRQEKIESIGEDIMDNEHSRKEAIDAQKREFRQRIAMNELQVDLIYAGIKVILQL